MRPWILFKAAAGKSAVQFTAKLTTPLAFLFISSIKSIFSSKAPSLDSKSVRSFMSLLCDAAKPRYFCSVSEDDLADAAA